MHYRATISLWLNGDKITRIVIAATIVEIEGQVNLMREEYHDARLANISIRMNAR